MLDLSQYWSEFGGNHGNYFRRNIMFQLGADDYGKNTANFKSEYKNTDIFQCVYYYENEDKDNCKLYGPLYFDLDGDIHNNFDELRQDVVKIVIYLKTLGLSENDVEIYFSGAKGFHILVRGETLGIMPSTNLNDIYKAWASYLYNTHKVRSIDLKIYDRKRLFRIPGSINSKTGLYKYLVDFEFLKKCSARELLLLAENPLVANRKPEYRRMNRAAALNFYTKSQNFYRKDKSKPIKKKTIIPTGKKELLPCVKAILETGVGEGSRNNTLSILSSAVLQSGYTLEETIDLMHDWNTNNEPPLPDREIEITVRSSYSMLLDDRHYGCRAMKGYGYCIEDCKLRKEGN